MKTTNKWVAGLSSLALVAMTMGASVPAYAYASHTAMQKSEIVVNGKVLSHPYKYAYNGTTYMPIWYIMQALKATGNKISWNGRVWKIWADSSQSTQYKGEGGPGEVQWYPSSNPTLLGATLETNVNLQVHTDPASGVRTTFFPIYDIQVILTDLGYPTDNWNGNTGVWNIGNQVVASTGSQAQWQNPPLPKGVSMTQYNAAAKSATQASNLFPTAKTYPQDAYGNYGLLATKTQWYPNPSDIFYNKQFPVSELKNGKVLQKKPFVIVTTPDETNGDTGGGYVYVLEYVGYGLNASGSPATYWKELQVGLNHGYVRNIMGGLITYGTWTGSNGFPLLKPPAGVQGINFGTVQPLSLWCYGFGDLNVVPKLNWNPTVN